MPSPTVNELYAPRFDLPAWKGKPAKSYMLATVPRTGSTYLSIELWRTGALGAPLEYINFASRAGDMLPRFAGDNIVDYWQKLIEARTSPNGVFGFKAFMSDFRRIAQKNPQLLNEVEWDKIVYLTRENKLEQAISYARAFQTKVWYAGQKPQAKPSFNEAAIDQALEWILSAEKDWETLFATHHWQPLRVTYEDVTKDVGSVVQRIATYLDVDLGSATRLTLPSAGVQRDALSQKWMDQYVSGKNK